jgi:hypothetical protein
MKKFLFVLAFFFSASSVFAGDYFVTPSGFFTFSSVSISSSSNVSPIGEEGDYVYYGKPSSGSDRGIYRSPKTGGPEQLVLSIPQSVCN